MKDERRTDVHLSQWAFYEPSRDLADPWATGAATTESVSQEVMALGQFRHSYEVTELLSLRRHAWRRAAFPKPERQLSELQNAWRKMFSSLDELLRNAIGSQKKADLDALEMREANLALAARMLQLRREHHPNESRVGVVMFSAAIILGVVTGWLLARSLLVGVLLGTAGGIAGLSASALIFQNHWSSNILAAFLVRLGRGIGSEHLRQVAGRIIETNCLRADEFYRTGDPQRAMVSLRRLDESLREQEKELAAALSILHSQAYKHASRNPEQFLVRADLGDHERLGEAKKLLETITRYRSEVVDRVDWANKESEEELYEFERLLVGLRSGDVRTHFESWYQSAKREYFNGRVMTNIVRNWFDMDGGIAAQIIAHHGRADFKMRPEPIAEIIAQIEMLDSLRESRKTLRANRDVPKRELLGLLHP